MDCNEAEDLLEAYLLGALDGGDLRLMESHVETCPTCGLRLHGLGETIVRLALAVPQLDAPPRVKQQLITRLEAEVRSESRVHLGRKLAGYWTALSRYSHLSPARAAASLLVIVLLIGGFWFDSRLDQMSRDSDMMAGQLEVAAEQEALVMDIVADQRNFTYEALQMSASPGTSVNMLSSNDRTATAHGLMMVSDAGTRALLLAVNLPPLPNNKVYQVWLIKSGRKYSAGFMTVDSTGFGKAIIIPESPFGHFDAIGITVEPLGGSIGPTSDSVLDGDL